MQHVCATYPLKLQKGKNTGQFPVTCVHTRVQLCMHNLPPEVMKGEKGGMKSINVSINNIITIFNDEML